MKNVDTMNKHFTISKHFLNISIVILLAFVCSLLINKVCTNNNLVFVMSHWKFSIVGEMSDRPLHLFFFQKD